jgi:hypothetical protein
MLVCRVTEVESRSNKLELPGKYHLVLKDLRNDAEDCAVKISRTGIYTSNHLSVAQSRLSVTGNKGAPYVSFVHTIGHRQVASSQRWLQGVTSRIGVAGYRLARATHAAPRSGSWYYEITVELNFGGCDVMPFCTPPPLVTHPTRTCPATTRLGLI